MALSIKNPQTEELARELATRTGESITEAVETAVRSRLASLDRPSMATRGRQRAERLLRQRDDLPDLDTRSADEILGYDDRGLP
jgi:antitoxin VapB